MTLFMSESYKSVVLKKRAKKLGINPSPDLKRSAFDNMKYFVTKTITRPIYMMFTEPIVTLFDIYNAFNFGLLNAFFAAFSWVYVVDGTYRSKKLLMFQDRFQNVYGFDLGATGLSYLGQAVGSIAGLFIILYVYNYYWSKETELAKQNGKAYMPPEKRLIIAKIGGPMFPISYVTSLWAIPLAYRPRVMLTPDRMFWFAWTARPDIHWISPIIAESFFSCGNLLIFTCTGLYFTDCYGAVYSASAW